MQNKSSLRAKIFIILLVMSEILAIVLTVAMVLNYQEAIKSYYGNVGSNISQQIADHIDIAKLRIDYEKEEISEDLTKIKETLNYFLNHYSLHEISIFSINDNYVTYIADTSRDEYYEMNFDRLSIENEKLKYVDDNIINISDVIELNSNAKNDPDMSNKYIETTIASYIDYLGDKNIDPPIYLSINFVVDVIHNQIKNFAISIIAFCTIALIFEGLILFIYIRYLVIDPLNQFSDNLNQIETDKDLRKLDLSRIDDNSIEISNFKKEVINIINKFNQYSDLLNESIIENRKSQYAIKTLNSFAEERGLPTSFYNDENENYILCGMLDTVNNRFNKNFYNSFMIDDHRLCILVFEINQESMASVLFMDMLSSKIKQDTMNGIGIADIFTKISKFMLDIDWVGISVNAYEAIVNLRDGDVEYVVAGDIYTSILVDKGIYKEYIDVPLQRMPRFSVKENAVFKSSHFTLLPNEKLFVYTNEILNILSLESGRYGKEFLLQFLNDNINENTSVLYNHLIDKIIDIRNEKSNCNMDCAFLLLDVKKYIGDKDVDLS